MALVQAVENGKITESTTETTTSAGNDLGYGELLQLLCAEMQYQDPLEPTSNTEYVAQLATFSQMESMLNMQNGIESTKGKRSGWKVCHCKDNIRDDRRDDGGGRIRGLCAVREQPEIHLCQRQPLFTRRCISGGRHRVHGGGFTGRGIQGICGKASGCG